MTPERLAKRILASRWFSRREAIRLNDHDESSCAMCRGHGGYHDYDVDWHDAECPIRWACGVLGRTVALAAGNEADDEFDGEIATALYADLPPLDIKAMLRGDFDELTVSELRARFRAPA